MSNSFLKFQKKVYSCRKCTRLVKFRNQIVKKKRKSYEDQKYWGKPVSGFGDINAKIVLVGLAPAAHGATRTGRVFTGDKSANFLFKCLHQSRLANQPNSDHLKDGLQLKNIFITLALRCVPPQDKPKPEELKNCSNYFKEELFLLKNKKIIIALGKIAFDACIRFYKQNFNISGSYKFGHGLKYKIYDIILLGCYHPSPRNVNTKRINEKMMINLFNKAKKLR